MFIRKTKKRFLQVLIFSISVSLLISCDTQQTKVVVKEGGKPMAFPSTDFDQVIIFSIDRYAESEERLLGRMNYLTGHEAKGFVDSTGRLIHQQVNKILLSKRLIDSLSVIFREVPREKGDKTSYPDCIPVYRDAIIYYKDEKPVAWVNICFSCEMTAFNPRNTYMYGFDNSVQNIELREFFKKLGYKPEGRP